MPFFTTSLSLLTSTGAGTNLSISDLSSSAFQLIKSDFVANLDVLVPVAFFRSVFVAELDKSTLTLMSLSKGSYGLGHH